MKSKRTKYTLRSDGRIVMTKTIQGKRVCFYGRTDKEVEQKYADYLKAEPKNSKPKVRTFDKVAEAWWAEKEPELSPNSVRNYKALYQFVKDEFDKCPVDEITPADIAAHLRKLAAQGYSQKAISNRKSVIKSILDNALVHGEIQFNPCINLPPVKGKPKVPRQSATDADVEAIEAHRSDSNIGRMFHFVLWTGCRRGEAEALREKDIDRERGVAHIVKTIASYPENI